MEIFGFLDNFISTLITLLGNWGALLGCIFILFESILPILPLSVFITLNFMTFGSIWGFIISWLFTVIGCMLSFYIFKNGLSEKLYNKFKNVNKLSNFMDIMQNMNFANLVLVIAIPFTPAFLINIAAGISRVDTKKYFYALLIGKISLVYFWGYIGVSLVESLKSPIILIKVVFITGVMYLISYIVNKKLNLK